MIKPGDIVSIKPHGYFGKVQCRVMGKHTTEDGEKIILKALEDSRMFVLAEKSILPEKPTRRTKQRLERPKNDKVNGIYIVSAKRRRRVAHST